MDWTAELRRLMPFAEVLDLEVDRAGPAGVWARGRWDAQRCTAGGVLHGGVLMASADSIAALCAQLNLPDGATGSTTVEAGTHFFAAVREGSFTVVAEPVHAGRSTVVVQTDIRTGERLASRSVQTQAALWPRS